MTRKPILRRGRMGFTLIELLIVIAIIAILVGLIVGASIKIFGKSDEVKCRKDISTMQTSLATFMQDRSLDGVPSRLLLKEDGKYDTGIRDEDLQLAKDSRLFLKKTFPNCALVNMDWNQNGQIDANYQVEAKYGRQIDQTYVILDGSQVLVFLLGGLGGVKGFSTNPVNPLDYVSRRDRIGPFYEFDTKRLTAETFPRFLDPWGTPYAFLSSYGHFGVGKYNRYGIPGVNGAVSDSGPEPYYVSVDARGVRTYHNPKTFQIISAGADKQFGPGGLWGANYPALGAGNDDFSNFHTSRLGAP